MEVWRDMDEWNNECTKNLCIPEWTHMRFHSVFAQQGHDKTAMSRAQKILSAVDIIRGIVYAKGF